MDTQYGMKATNRAITIIITNFFIIIFTPVIGYFWTSHSSNILENSIFSMSLKYFLLCLSSPFISITSCCSSSANSWVQEQLLCLLSLSKLSKFLEFHYNLIFFLSNNGWSVEHLPGGVYLSDRTHGCVLLFLCVVASLSLETWGINLDISLIMNILYPVNHRNSLVT